MIVWKVQRPDGITILGLGLEQGNIDRLRSGQPIFRLLGPVGVLNIAVAIHYGESKEAMMKDMEKGGLSLVEQSVPPPGAMGVFPRGKMSEDDEGELTMHLSRDGDTVRLDFGKELSWVAMSRNDCKEFAARLLLMAEGAKDN